MISKGKLQCQGSPAAIKTRYGDGYKITTAAPVEGQTEWSVRDTDGVAPVLQYIESEGVEDYKVEAPTLEQAFLNVVADAKSSEAALTKQQGLPNSDSSSVDSARKRDSPNSELRPLDLSSGTVSNFWREIKAIYVKRWMIIRRSYIPVIAAIVIPIAVAVATRGLIAGYQMDSCTRVDSNSPAKLLKRQTSSYQLLDSFKDNRVLLGPSNFWGPEQYAAVAEVAGDYAYLIPTEKERDLASFQTEIKKDYRELPLGMYYDTAGKDDTIALNMELPLYYGAMPLNFFNQLRINQSGSDIKIEAEVAYFAQQDYTPPGLGWALIFIFFFGFAMALSASFPTLYPTFERVRKVRSLHYSNGVRPASLWLGHLLYESMWLILAGIICGIIFAALSPRNWYHAGFLVLVFALFGIASTLFAFVISLFAKSSLAAFPAMAGINSVMHTVFTVIYMVLFTVGSADKLVGGMDSSFYALGLAFPIANLDRALFISLNMFSLACNPETASNRSNAGLRTNPGAFDLYGGPIFYLILQSCFFFAFLIWWESGRPIPHRRLPPPVYSTYADRPKEADTLVVTGLRKTFGKYTAVDNVSFAVQRNETFCLLGPNGAGKTTSISLILGELSPDSGDVYVNGHSISRHRAKARNFLGVCPQFDAIDNLTVAQTLKFYAVVKGVPKVAHNVSEIIRAVGLEAFVDRKADALSGGNRRKLSLGIALMGNPAVMLLDEPSSGMDAAAKRTMWRTLRAVSKDRAIVLTTHSMEESDALASRVGILGGRMLALGTVAELRKAHGAFLYIHLVHKRAPHATEEEMERMAAWVEKTFGVHTGRGVLGQIKFRVEEARWKVGAVFRVLGDLEGLGEFSVASTTLEDVFLEVSRRYEEEKEKEKVQRKKEVV
jgi:ATP-binding cassette subfamily A (ABC1) protein 3